MSFNAYSSLASIARALLLKTVLIVNNYQGCKGHRLYNIEHPHT